MGKRLTSRCALDIRPSNPHIWIQSAAPPQWVRNARDLFQEIDLSKKTTAATPLNDVKAFAKKHRIEIEDAQTILDQYGDDRKNADKAARRIAA